MDAYSTVFGERYQSQLEKEAGIRAMFKGVGRGLKQTMDQSAATSLVKKRRKATSALRNTRDQQQAMFQQAQDTLDAAKSKSGLGRLWGNIKGNYLNAKAEGLSDKMGDLNRRINRYDNKLGSNAHYKARQNKVMANRAARENALSQQAQQKPLNFGDGNTDVHYGTTAPGQTAVQQVAPTNAATTKAQTKAVASDTMNGKAPAPVKGQPAAPQPTAPKGDAAPAQATAPQPTAPKGNGADAPDATQPTAPQPTAPKKPVKSTPPAQQADPDLPPTPQGGAPQGGVPQQGMMNPQGMMTPQGYMQPYPFAMQAPQPGMSTSEKLMMAGMLGNLSMPAYMYMMSRNNDE